MQMLRGTAYLTCIFYILDLSQEAISNENANSALVRQSLEYRLCPRALEYVVGTSLRHIVTRVVRLAAQGLPVGAGVAAGSAKSESHVRTQARSCRDCLTTDLQQWSSQVVLKHAFMITAWNGVSYFSAINCN